MRGAATAELLRCAEPLRSVGAVDCDSNTTMVAHRLCGTLDCATSLSSSTPDLQRRTWGMHCARALVSGFAGAASAPRRAPACVCTSAIRAIVASAALVRGDKQRTRRSIFFALSSAGSAGGGCRVGPTDRDAGVKRPGATLCRCCIAPSRRGHGLPHILFGLWWALIKCIREELNPDRCRSGADYIRNHKARRGLASKGGLRRPSLQGARQR